MGIKSLEELRQIRENNRYKTSLRHVGEQINEKSEQIEILIGMATCGIAAGARETLTEIMEQLSANNICDVKVIPVGCIGICKQEPLIQINMPNSEPVAYGNVKKENVKSIIESHIINKSPLESMVIKYKFDRAR